MKQYLKPYYIFNTILLLVYPAVRLYTQRVYFLKQEDTFGYTRENGILCTALAVLFIRYKRSATLEHFFHSIFTVGKLSILVLLLLLSLKYFLYYAFACSVMFLFVRQPKFQGRSKMVKITSEEKFDELINKRLNPVKKPSRSGKEANTDFAQMNMWLVEFFVDWAETCVYTKPIWAEYSNKYTTQNLKFGEVNLGSLPELAKRYNINTSAVSRQLPTLILFEDGKEVNRFPPYDEEKKRYMRVVKYSKKDIAKYFDIEERYLATRFTNNINQDKQTIQANKKTE